MNQKTLDRLKNNPHYKISSKQYSEPMTDEEEGTMVEFGRPPQNTTTFETHQTSLKKTQRTSRK